jgi:hypothetical protein
LNTTAKILIQLESGEHREIPMPSGGRSLADALAASRDGGRLPNMKFGKMTRRTTAW